MKTFEITYINRVGNKKSVDVEGYLEYMAVERFKWLYIHKKIISVKQVN